MLNTTTIFCVVIKNKLCSTAREFDVKIMNKRLETLKISLIIILGGMIIPALLSIIFSGFKINLISIINFEFFIGLLVATIGGLMIVGGYSRFRKKVLKTPVDREVEENEYKDRIRWDYLLFITGLVIMLASISLGEIF